MMIDFNKLYAFFYSFIRYYDDYCLMYVSDVSLIRLSVRWGNDTGRGRKRHMRQDEGDKFGESRRKTMNN